MVSSPNSGTGFGKSVFWRAAIPFGIAMGVMQLVQGRWLAAAISAAIGGSLFGGWMVWKDRRARRKLPGKGIRATDLNPIRERSKEIAKSSDEAFEASRRALLTTPKLKIVSERRENGELHAKTGMTWRGFGEVLTVRVLATGRSLSRVTIRSEPKLKTTTVDYGKAVENVETFLAHL